MYKFYLHFAISIFFLFPCHSTFLTDLTLEEKVGQLLMVHFQGEDANDDAKKLIQDLHIGSIIYYNWSNSLSCPEQVKKLSKGLQKLAKENKPSIPLLIATDQEGGLVSRIQGCTIFPGNKALGMTLDPSLTEESAYIIGEELKSIGINLNLAPVADINNNPKNPVIGIRSFSDSPKTVTKLVRKALNGYKKAKILTSLKHFPGHGNVETDSHTHLPVVKKPLEDLEKEEFLPFIKLASEADTIMSAHLLVPALDKENCSTLSKKTIDYLRSKIHFNGVLITDSLVMEGVLKNHTSIIDVAIKALNAGADLLLLGGRNLQNSHSIELNIKDIELIHRSLVEAVKKGIISEKRINEAVGRILTLKSRYDLTALNESKDLLVSINSEERQELAKKIALLSIKTKKNNIEALKSIEEKKVLIIGPNIARDLIQNPTLFKINKDPHLFFFSELNPSKEEIFFIENLSKKADIILSFSYNAWQNPSQINLIQSLIYSNKPSIVIALKDPLDESLFLNANLILTTFSPTKPAIEAVYQQILNFKN